MFSLNEDEELLLQHPAAKALQMMKFSSEEILDAMNALRERQSHISAQKLKIFIERKQKEKIDLLLAETQKLKFAITCKICMEAKIDILFLPCRHLLACETCANRVKNCPVCKKRIIEVSKVKM